MLCPLIVLSAFTICIAYVMRSFLGGSVILLWKDALVLNGVGLVSVSMEYRSTLLKFFPLFFSFSGVVIILVLSFLVRQFSSFLILFFSRRFFYNFCIFGSQMWHFDFLYGCVIKVIMLVYYEVYVRVLDKGYFEILGPYGFMRLFFVFMRRIVSLQSGLIYQYIYMMVQGLTFYL